MNFSWLLPSAFAALAALALPLLIHLSRRAEHKPTEFAALRWLRAQRRPQRKWLLQERVLLAIRLLLLIALAIFLAQPVITSSVKPAHWVVVAPGANVAQLKQPPTGNHVQWHWLSPGYPAIDQMPSSTSRALSSLLRELDSQLPAKTELSVVVPEQLAGLDGERIRLSRKVHWLITSGSSPQSVLAKSHKPLQLAIRYDAAHAKSATYFRAAQGSWNTNSQGLPVDVALLSNTPPEQTRVLVWLASGELPPNIAQWVQQGGTLLASKDVSLPKTQLAFPVWRDDQGTVLLREWQVAHGRILQWQVPLQPANMPVLLEAKFPERLIRVLQTSPAPLSTSLASQQQPQKVNMAWPLKPEPVWSWLVWLIVLLFMAERWLSGRRKTWAST